MNNLLYLFFLIIFLIIENFSAKAEESPIFSSSFFYEETSDSINRTLLDINYRNNRRDMTYPYNNESESAWDFAAQAIITYGYSSLDYYNGEKFQFLGARKFSKSFLIETFAGFHSLNITSTDSSDVLPVGGMRVYFILPDSLETIFSGSYDYIYLDLMQPRGISDKIAATALNADISYHWSENWKSQIRYESKFLTDSNQKMYVDFSTMYGIYNDTPWLWVGIGGEDTEFKNQVTGYWAPEQFVTFGVRLDSVFPLFGNFSGSFGFNGNELYDKGTDSWGNGYYLSAKLQYGDRNAPNASLFFNNTLSMQNDNQWSSYQMGANLTITF